MFRKRKIMSKHVHADLIKAWADGAEIEAWDKNALHWYHWENPRWMANIKYRIKPAEKIVRWLWAWQPLGTNWNFITDRYYTETEIANSSMSDGECKKLEWSREEFEE